MPFCPFFCPYMNQPEDEDENLRNSGDFRSPNGFPFPGFPGQGPGSGFGPGFPGQGPGQGFGPPFGGGQDGPPSGPPPSITPSLKSSGGPTLKAVDPGSIRPCRYRFVYIWLDNGRSFWAWLTFVGPRSVSGYRWNGFRWRYFGVDLRRIDSFECY